MIFPTHNSLHLTLKICSDICPWALCVPLNLIAECLRANIQGLHIYIYIHDFSVSSDNACIQIDREWNVDGRNTSWFVDAVRHRA